MLFRSGMAVVTRVIGQILIVLAQLLRRLFDLIERVAIERVVQHVFEQCAIDVGRVGVQVIAIGLNQGIDNPAFLTWLQQTVKR